MPFPSGSYILQIVDAAVRAELEQFYSLLQGWLIAEHKEDGTHGDLTADSVTTTTATVEEDLTVNGNVTADADESPAVLGDTSSLTSLTGSGLSLKTVQGGSTISHWGLVARGADGESRELSLHDCLELTLARVFGVYRRTSGGSGTFNYYITPGSLVGLSLGENDTAKLWDEIHCHEVRASAGYYERLRTVPVGEFTTFVPTLTASTGLWNGATVARAAYRIVGKEARVEFNIHSSNVSATPADLIMSLPAAITPTAAAFRTIQVSDAGAAAAVGIARVAASTAEIRFQSTAAGGAWALTAGNNTFVRGDIAFEI